MQCVKEPTPSNSACIYPVCFSGHITIYLSKWCSLYIRGHWSQEIDWSRQIWSFLLKAFHSHTYSMFPFQPFWVSGSLLIWFLCSWEERTITRVIILHNPNFSDLSITISAVTMIVNAIFIVWTKESLVLLFLLIYHSWSFTASSDTI